MAYSKLLPCFLLALVCLLSVSSRVAAQSNGTSNGTSPFLVNLTPAGLPWQNATGTQSFQGASQVAPVVVSRLILGPCTYRQFHYHATADETFYVADNFVESYLVAPNNNTVIMHNITKYDVLVYPRGWSHLQYNPTCTVSEAFITFNEALITTVNVVNNLVALPAGYLDSAFEDVPQSKGLWAINQDCAVRCNIAYQ